MIPMPKIKMPKPLFIIIKQNNGFVIKKRIRETRYYKILFLFKKYYESIRYVYVLKDNISVGSLGVLDTDVRIFETKKEVKKYIKENTIKKYYIY